METLMMRPCPHSSGDALSCCLGTAFTQNLEFVDKHHHTLSSWREHVDNLVTVFAEHDKHIASSLRTWHTGALLPLLLQFPDMVQS